MKWDVAGADQFNGQDVTIEVSAGTAEEAEEMARRRGLLVNSVTARESPDLIYTPPTAPEPELVWYGQMYCNECGYQWKARRNTPPARCASCSRRDIAIVKEPRRAGCVTSVALFVGAAWLAKEWCGL